MAFFANTTLKGVVRTRQLPSMIGIYDSADRSIQVGIASMVGLISRDAALWSLEVRGVLVPGRFLIVNGEFSPFMPQNE
jgi:hypothetical protein